MIPKYSVKKSVTVIIVMLIILILGTYSIMDLNTDLMPSMNLPYAVVITNYPGSNPTIVENYLTRNLESATATIDGIKNIESISSDSSSILVLEFEQNTNMETAIVELRESLDMVMAYMPSEVTNPMILRLDPSMMPIMAMGVSVEGMSNSEVSEYVEETVVPELEKIGGVATVSASGMSSTQLNITIDNDKLDQLNEDIIADMVAKQMAIIEEQMRQQMQEQLANMPAEIPAMPTEGEQLPEGTELPAGTEIPTQTELPTQTEMPIEMPVDITQDIEMPEAIVTIDMIKGIISAQNFSMPSGYITENETEYLVRVGDDFADMDAVKNLTVYKDDSRTVLLSDIAEVGMFEISDNTYSKINGENGITLTVQKQSSAVTTEISSEIMSAIDDLKSENSAVDVTVLMDQADYINKSLETVNENLIIGAVLAVLILFIFLRDIKPTLIVALSIPISLLATFTLMYFSGVTLNILSMGGLALAVGMIVDNSIVVIENIYRLRNSGMDSKKASIDGANQVVGAIISSTITTVCVFLPILFVGGMIGEIFRDMALTITFSLVCSLAIALSLVPMASSKILAKKMDVREHKGLEFVKRIYTKILKFSLKTRALVIILVILLFAGSLYMAFNSGTEFFPTTDEGQLSITLTMENGSDFNTTAEAVDKLTEAIMTNENVDIVSASFGGSGFISFMQGGGSGNGVSMTVLLKEDREKSTVEVASDLKNLGVDINGEYTIEDQNTMSTSMLTGSGVTIEVVGTDFDIMEAMAQDAAEIMAGVEGIIDIDNGINKSQPELQITVDREKSIEKGLTTAQVYGAISGIINEDTQISTLSTANKELEIHLLESNAKTELSLEEIQNFVLVSPTGEEVILSDIADVELAEGFGSITRYNQKRILSVTGKIDAGYNSGLIGQELNDAVEEYQAESGYTMRVAGATEQLESALRDIITAMLLAILLIYLVMAAQFQSFKHPFIVLFSIPLAFTGGFIALLIAGLPISIVACVGFVILFGVVVNNGIVLVDYINKLKEEGKHTYDAIVLAGQTRLRPIIMTALTTILALLPMAVGYGDSAELMQPMAITAIGGLIFATLMTLIVVPCIYSVMDRNKPKHVKK